MINPPTVDKINPSPMTQSNHLPLKVRDELQHALLVARATKIPIVGIDSTATAASSHSPAPAMLAAAISARSTGSRPIDGTECLNLCISKLGD
jgi:hypothetical protein